MKTGRISLAEGCPSLAAQWHPTKNGDLTPDQVAMHSNRKVWWRLSYDDPVTGRHFDFEWKAIIKNRVKGCGCPFLSGKAVWPGFNDLQTRAPLLAAQWHPTKNGDLTPDQVAMHSNRKVWWRFSYDDPVTGRHFDFEWEAIINDRVKENDCPFLSGRAVWPGFNDLQTKAPLLAAEWHPTKNRWVKPTGVTYKSSKKAWWLCPHCSHEWRSMIGGRTIYGTRCPQCGK